VGDGQAVGLAPTGSFSTFTPSTERAYDRPVLRGRYLAWLSAELIAYAYVNRAWWVPVLTLIIALAALAIAVGQAAAPVGLYPLF
jgi:hypothetical protein